MSYEPWLEARSSRLKAKKYESQSINKETQRRLQNSSQKRQAVCYQQKKSAFQAETRII